MSETQERALRIDSTCCLWEKFYDLKTKGEIKVLIQTPMKSKYDSWLASTAYYAESKLKLEDFC